jgi:hypothetical protein
MKRLGNWLWRIFWVLVILYYAIAAIGYFVG